MPTTPPPPSRWTVTLSDVADALLSLVTTAVGLGAGVAIADDVSASNPGAVLLAALLVALGDLVLRPALRVLARLGGAMGALAAGLGAQVLVAWLALSVVPGVQVRNAWSVVPVLLIAAVVMALGRWVWGASDSDYVVADVVRRARARARRAGTATPAAGASDTRPPGLLVVQLDGVAEPVLAQAVDAGLVPTMARWITRGSHRLDSWWAQVPSTTPASQAGLLHGAADAIPSFRWWDHEAGRLVVTNHPDDAALVERRLSDGAGLLAGGGAAVSTMFSGDAARQLLVMSQARRGIGPGTSYLRFFASPFVLARAVSLTVGEMVKEIYQGRRQQVRDVRPRVPRRGWYVVLRGVTNVLLRDLATSLVAEQLVGGAPTVFVDLVDYDEIAHHAGPTRPESLRALEGLDQVLGTLEQVIEVAPRDYRIVVLSDHGQTLGATFEQVAGRPLVEVVRTLMSGAGRSAAGGDPVAAVQAAGDEEWGPLNAFLSTVTSHRGDDRPRVLGPQGRDRRAADKAGRAGSTERAGLLDRGAPVGRAGFVAGPSRVATDDRAPVADHGPAADRAAAADRAPSAADETTPGARRLPEVAVTGSGNLGMVWFPRAGRRLVLEEVEQHWPGLVRGLAGTPGIGLVLVDTAARGLMAVGAGGVAWLEATGADGLAAVDGADPLARYGSMARGDLARLGRLRDVGDLVLISDLTAAGHVHAFEGQVGSHGGIGGPQNHALLLHPVDLPLDDDLLAEVRATDVAGRRLLVGADRVHDQLLRWATGLGLRQGRR